MHSLKAILHLQKATWLMYAIPLKPKTAHLGTISALPENISDLLLQNTSKKYKISRG